MGLETGTCTVSLGQGLMALVWTEMGSWTMVRVEESTRGAWEGTVKPASVL